MSKLITCSICNIKENKMVTDLVSGEIVCSNCGTVAIDGIEENGRNGEISMTLRQIRVE